ncbi:hypothetical protein [Candidatus Ichthyocystis hellenicum]|uniref:hypothetical protein n=1 Tax=Candidatus Ichthyocystis hellenicum TaxID=1561003 RepID=UPI00111227FF|nr:hypothetical protein [Candidatus Ichthyocystis hellenicum]
MKKTLPIVAALVSTLFVTGCFDDDTKPKPEPKPDRLELKQLMEVPGLAVYGGPLGLTLSDDGTLIATGLGDIVVKRDKSGAIYTADPGSSKLVERTIESDVGEDYYGFSSVAYSKLRNSLFVCSVPLLSFGGVAPAVVEFELDNKGDYEWKGVMEFSPTRTGQVCKGMKIQNNNLLVVNTVAIDGTYPVLYRIDLSTNPALPAQIPVFLRYADLGYTASDMLAESVVDISADMLHDSMPTNPGDFHIYLLDRAKSSIDEVLFEASSGTILITKSGFDRGIIADPLSFIDFGKGKFILSGGAHDPGSPTAIYEVQYHDGGNPSYKFLGLAPSPIPSFAYGQSRSGSGNSLYASLASADEKGKFHVAEYSYTG